MFICPFKNKAGPGMELEIWQKSINSDLWKPLSDLPNSKLNRTTIFDVLYQMMDIIYNQSADFNNLFPVFLNFFSGQCDT